MNTSLIAGESRLSALRDIAITMFDTMLQLTVVAGESQIDTLGYELTAAVGYAGSGKGGVLLECRREQAMDWCARLCCLPQPVSAEDARDGLGELCNILAGNFKPLLPRGTTLATPFVWEGKTQHRLFAACELAGTAELLDRGLSFRISLFLG